jgi:hypothetical protein
MLHRLSVLKNQGPTLLRGLARYFVATTGRFTDDKTGNIYPVNKKYGRIDKMEDRCWIWF